MTIETEVASTPRSLTDKLQRITDRINKKRTNDIQDLANQGYSPEDVVAMKAEASANNSEAVGRSNRGRAGTQIIERAQMSLDAGCDMLVVCNNSEGADEILDMLKGYNNPTSQLRMIRMHGKPSLQSADIFNTEQWQQSVARLEFFNQHQYPSGSGDFFE